MNKLFILLEIILFLKSTSDFVEDNYSEFDPVIYLDQDDKDLYEKVKSNTSLSVELSDKSFLGGTQTIVHKTNILIDHSFRTKLTECQNSFTVSM